MEGWEWGVEEGDEDWRGARVSESDRDEGKWGGGTSGVGEP